MLPSERAIVGEVIGRITRILHRDHHPVVNAEMIMELQQEFGAEPVKWAFRFLVARGVAQGPPYATSERDPMWDRELDG